MVVCLGVGSKVDREDMEGMGEGGRDSNRVGRAKGSKEDRVVMVDRGME